MFAQEINNGVRITIKSQDEYLNIDEIKGLINFLNTALHKQPNTYMTK